MSSIMDNNNDRKFVSSLFTPTKLLMVLSFSTIVSVFLWMQIEGPEVLKHYLSRQFPTSNKKLQRLISQRTTDKIIKLGKKSVNDSSAHKELLELVRKYCIEPPSKEPYNLKENDWPQEYKFQYPSWIFIDSVVKDLFKNKTSGGGFFVEAGASDGEMLSNTLSLETKLNWTGLLVEVEHKNYLKLRKKNRKAWSAPICLATKPYPNEIILSTYSGKEDGPARIRNNLTNTAALESSFYEAFQNGLCLPTKTLLEALDVNHVDFFSLDVEGVEVDILQNFPFDEITVDVWAIEHINKKVKPRRNKNSKTVWKEDEDFLLFMEKNGYYFFDIYCEMIPDYIFIRRESKIFKELEVPPKFLKRRGLCRDKVFDEKRMLASLRDHSHWPHLKFNLSRKISESGKIKKSK